MNHIHNEIKPVEIPTENSVRRYSNGTVAALNRGDSNLLSTEGTICLNPNADDHLKVYEKQFLNREVALGTEFSELFNDQQFVPESEKVILNDLIRLDKPTLTLGITGYSSLTEEFREQYGMRDGSYEELTFQLSAYVLDALRNRFQDFDFVLTNGASDYGIDGVTNQVGKQLDIPVVGFNQPDWIFWVEDNDQKLYIAHDKQRYHRAFAEATDILLSMGGRADAMYHDSLNAERFDKAVVGCHVLKFLCSKGAPSGRDRNDKSHINDASKAFLDSNPALLRRSESLDTIEKLADGIVDDASYYIEQRVRSSDSIARVAIPNDFSLTKFAFSR